MEVSLYYISFQERPLFAKGSKLFPFRSKVTYQAFEFGSMKYYDPTPDNRAYLYAATEVQLGW